MKLTSKLSRLKFLSLPFNIWLLLVLGFIFRLLLTPYLTYHLDIATYITWSQRLFSHGLSNFYSSNWVDYLPGYPYILYVLAFLKQALNLSSQNAIYRLYKLPAILADILSAGIIYKLLYKEKKNFSLFTFHFSLATVATAAYLFNPAIYANSALWGQTDSFTALFALASLLLINQQKPFLSGLSLGLGCLVKINTLFIAPVLALLILRQKNYLKKGLILGFVTLSVFILGFLPFKGNKPLAPFILSRLNITTGQYPHTSVNAFNFWFLLEGAWQSDQAPVLSLTKHTWGNLIFLTLTFLFITLTLINKKITLQKVYTLAAAIFTAAFLFLTRMHERHFFPALAFLLLLSFKTPGLISYYLYFSFSYLLNLIFAYQQLPNHATILKFQGHIPKLLSFLNLIVLGFLSTQLTAFKSLFSKVSRLFKTEIKKPQTKLLIILLSLSFSIRIFRLSIPHKFHFDEVYHAFTAQEMLKGNPMAWEWWNTPPQGVAYEWTHPPVAKYFMVAGMALFGINSFGWRLPGVIIGTINIYLVYLISQKLFSNSKLSLKGRSLKVLPLLAAGLYSLETLTFVQSRIGMNDTYMISFILLSLLMMLKQKYPFAAISFGLGLATKWSALYAAPVLGFTYLSYMSHKTSPAKTILSSIKVGIGFILVPIGIYLLSYLPFFTSGHSKDQFIELQKQMYWYHTRLQATHNYSSPWWSWTIMKRPVWYFVDYGKNTIANIYAFGNPLIFLSGLLAILWAIKNVIYKKGKKFIIHNSLFILLIGYLAFLLPWSFSPRIMFLYHYLPSIPFLVIILAWALIRLYYSGKTGRNLTICYLLFAICLFVLLYPHLTAIHVPQSWLKLYHFFPSWK